MIWKSYIAIRPQFNSSTEPKPPESLGIAGGFGYVWKNKIYMQKEYSEAGGYINMYLTY
jgi:hypothetical protein